MTGILRVLSKETHYGTPSTGNFESWLLVDYVHHQNLGPYLTCHCKSGQAWRRHYFGDVSCHNYSRHDMWPSPAVMTSENTGLPTQLHGSVLLTGYNYPAAILFLRKCNYVHGAGPQAPTVLRLSPSSSWTQCRRRVAAWAAWATRRHDVMAPPPPISLNISRTEYRDRTQARPTPFESARLFQQHIKHKL